MVMSDKEILQRFRKMDGSDSARVQILAELNGCEKKYIEAALADAGIEIKKPGRPKQEKQQHRKNKQSRESQAQEVYPKFVISAVKSRMADLEERVAAWNEQIDAAMEEWSKLKEWLTSYGKERQI